MSFFDNIKTKKNYDAKLIFLSFATFFWSSHFFLIIGAKQRFCFTGSMSVLDQNGSI